MSGGWPGQGVCTITWTSEMSGRAARETWRRLQMPARTSRAVAEKTRKRLPAHQSIQRAIILGTSLGRERELPGGEGLAVAGGGDGDLPRAAGREIGGGLVDAGA